MALLAERGDGAEMLSLRAAQQAVDDFALDEAAEKWNVLRRIEQIDEPRTCAEQFERSDADGHAAGVGGFVAQMKFLLGENLADCGISSLSSRPSMGSFSVAAMTWLTTGRSTEVSRKLEPSQT